MSIRRALLLASFCAAAASAWAQSITPSPSALPEATINVAYSQQFALSPPNANVEWGFDPAMPAPGMTLNFGTPNPILQGTPTQAGVFPFTMTAAIPGSTIVQNYNLYVSSGALSFKESTLPSGIQGQSYTATLTPQGGVPPYFTCALSPGSSSDGLTFSLNSSGVCVLAGTPQSSGSYTINAVFEDAHGNISPATGYTLNINGTISITTSSLPNGEIGVVYGSANGVQLQESGGTAPFTWSVSPPLPAGLTLNNSTGAITGTPTAAGTTTTTVTVSYSPTAPAPISASQSYTIQIFNAMATTPLNVTANVNQALTSQQISLTGGSSPFTWAVTTGTLPAGLTLNPSTGAITGTPTTVGSTSITATVTDSLGATATAQVSFNLTTVTIPTVTVTLPPSLPNAQTSVPSVSIQSAYNSAITGTLTLTFNSNIPGGTATDPSVQFVNNAGGSSTVSFSIPAGSTTATFPTGTVVSAGTTAGTITIAVSALTDSNMNPLLPSPAPSATITIAQNPPVITKFTITQGSGTFTLTAVGYSSTREMVSGTVTFTATTSASLATSTFAIPLTSAFATWYSSSASTQFGTQFTVTIPFTFSSTAGTSSFPVAAASIILTNTIGPSQSRTANP